jgi:predicted glycosyltransferase
VRPIGYYVHHQGAGHWQRARRIAAALPRSCTLIGTFAKVDTADAPGPVLDLPDDRLDAGFSGEDGEATRPESLHYAPLDHPGIRARMAAIAAWAEREKPALLVVDVSVEVALFARLLSVPTIVFRLAGLRNDLPHLEAFRSAERLVAPFPAVLEDPGTPDWVRAKTFHAGFLTEHTPVAATTGEDVVVVLGRGGGGPTNADLVAAARAVPERRWLILGQVERSVAEPPPNLVLESWVDDVPRRLAAAGLVVGAAGDGTVAAAAAAGRPFLCLPEPRAYGEQTAKAEALARLGAAVVHPGWPAPEAWPGLIEATAALDPAPLAALAEPDAIGRLAAEIERVATATAIPLPAGGERSRAQHRSG